MTAPHDEGGYAFPIPLAQTNDGGIRHASEYGNTGMTLRDYFAAKAMQAIYTAGIPSGVEMKYDEVATGAYAAADAMLKARQA
jgi:hypothetical protein